MLVVPEGIVRLNATAAEALALVDGTRTVDAIAGELARTRPSAEAAAVLADVRDLFQRLRARRLVR